MKIVSAVPMFASTEKMHCPWPSVYENRFSSNTWFVPITPVFLRSLAEIRPADISAYPPVSTMVEIR